MSVKYNGNFNVLPCLYDLELVIELLKAQLDSLQTPLLRLRVNRPARFCPTERNAKFVVIKDASERNHLMQITPNY